PGSVGDRYCGARVGSLRAGPIGSDRLVPLSVYVSDPVASGSRMNVTRYSPGGSRTPGALHVSPGRTASARTRLPASRTSIRTPPVAAPTGPAESVSWNSCVCATKNAYDRVDVSASVPVANAVGTAAWTPARADSR